MGFILFIRPGLSVEIFTPDIDIGELILENMCLEEGGWIFKVKESVLAVLLRK